MTQGSKVQLNEKDKLARRVHNGLLIAFGIVLVLNFWTAYEKVKLNQRYERVIEQYEESFSKFVELNRVVEVMADRFEGQVDHQEN